MTFGGAGGVIFLDSANQQEKEAAAEIVIYRYSGLTGCLIFMACFMSNRHCHGDAVPRIMLNNSSGLARLKNFSRIHHKLEISPISDKMKFCCENFEDGRRKKEASISSNISRERLSRVN